MIHTNYTLDFTKLPASTWSDVKQLKDLVKTARHASQIITSTGEHTRVMWTSSFADVLTWHCLNPVKAKILFDSFNTAFQGCPEGAEKEKIREFIVRNHFLIGTKKTTFTLPKFSYQPAERDFNCFLEDVSNKLRQVYPVDTTAKKIDKTTVAILACNAGGGHCAVATAVQQVLNNKTDRYTAHVINVDELPGDTLSEVTNGAVKTWQIFSKFRCQENNHTKADLFCDLRWAIHQFLPRTSMHEVNQTIRKLGADVILNTIHHEVEWISPLMDIDRPVYFINTDYQLPPQLAQLKGCTDTSQFQVLTPIRYLDAAARIHPIGYPVRSGFEKKATDEDKNGVREKYQVKEGESLIVFQMGSLAMGLEKEIEKLLAASKNLKHKCHVVFLCTSNETAIQAIEKIQSTCATDQNCKVSLHPVGMQSDEELSMLYQTCRAVVGKAGGATSAEIAACGAYLLDYDSLPWELPNVKYLEGRSQCKTIHTFDDLALFVNNQVCAASTDAPVLDWKKNLVEQIDTVVKEHKSPPAQAIPVDITKPFKPDKARFVFIRHIKNIFSSFKTFLRTIKFIFAYLFSASIQTHITRLRHWWKYV